MKRSIILLLFAYVLSANTIFENFFSLQNSDLNLNNKTAQKELISKNGFNKSYIQKLRLNMGYSRFDKDSIDDEYELRIYLKTPSQIATQERLYQLKKEQVDLSYQEIKGIVLKNRYILLLDAYFIKKIYTNREKMLNLDKKMLSLFIKTTNTVSDVYELSKLKYRVQDSELSLLEEKNNYNYILEEIKKYIPLIDTKEIDKAIENISFIEINDLMKYENSDGAISTKKELIKLQILKQKIELNKILNSLRLNSFDLGYEDRGEIDKSFSVSFSLEYAWRKKDSLQSVENSLKLVDMQNKILVVKENENKKISLLKKEISTLQNRLTHLVDSIKNDKFSNSYFKLKNQDPLVVFKIKKRELEIKRRVFEIEHRLYAKFIDLLYVTNTLTKDALFKKYKKERI